jgi:Right handed beta helix region
MQCDSAKSVTFLWTKFLWAGGADLVGGGTTQTISVSKPNIPVDIEDCWFIGGQDNSIGVYNTCPVKILRNTMYGNGTSDGDCVDFHSGVSGVVAYNVIWGSAGSAIKIFTSSTAPVVETNCAVYNNTCLESGFRRGSGEPGRGVFIDAFSKARVYNNLLVNNYWSLDISSTSDFANTQYGYNYFYVTVDSLRQFMYPQGSQGKIQPSDIIDSVHLGVHDPMFVGYSVPPNPSNRIIPTNFDFHLKPGSPALGKGSSASISLPPGVTGVPGPSSDIGAYVSDTTGGKGNRH